MKSVTIQGRYPKATISRTTFAVRPLFSHVVEFTPCCERSLTRVLQESLDFCIDSSGIRMNAILVWNMVKPRGAREDSQGIDKSALTAIRSKRPSPGFPKAMARRAIESKTD